MDQPLPSSLFAAFSKELFLLTALELLRVPKGSVFCMYQYRQMAQSVFVCLFPLCFWSLTINRAHGFMLTPQFISVLASLPFKVHGILPVAGFNFAVQEVIVYSPQPLVL